MIHALFQYHFVILFTYPCFWEIDILIDHASAIKEGDQHYFAHWLLLMNLFCPGFATMEPHLWLAFHFRIIIMNPGFINSDEMREKARILGIHAKISKHTEWWRSISLAHRKWGTRIEQMHFIPSSFF